MDIPKTLGVLKNVNKDALVNLAQKLRTHELQDWEIKHKQHQVCII